MRIVLIALIALAAAGIWILSGPEPDRGMERSLAGSERPETPSPQLTSVDDLGSTGRRSADTSRAAEVGETNRASTRELSLTVVDARTGASIADLACVAFTESRPDSILAETRSGSDGVVRLGEVPLGKTVVVETERREPYCHSLTALWPSHWNAGGAVLRVGVGGTLAGRVVDDAGAPIEGAEIRLAADLAGPLWGARQGKDGTTLVTQTDAEGRFRVSAVVSRARGVWVVEGEPRPERFEDVKVVATHGGRRAEAAIAVVEGESKTLPDLVLPRFARLAGVVLDADRRPVASALVSANFQRLSARTFGSSTRGGPDFLGSHGDPGFQLESEEALSDASGRFELSFQTRGDKAPMLSQLLVATSQGLEQTFPLPALAPGAVLEDHVLELENRLLFELELLRERDGRSITEEGAFAELMRGERRQLRDGRGMKAFLRVVAFEVLWDDGGREVVESPPRPGSFFRVSFRRRPAAALSALEINAPGYLTRRVPVTTGGGLVCRLEECPSYAFELIVRREGTPPDLSWNESIRACLLDEAELREHPERCCGLGSLDHLAGQGALTTHRLEVPTVGRYWLYVHCDDEERVLGPYLPGSEPIVIDLPAAQAPAERTPAGNAACTVEVVDAVTLEPIRDAWATLWTSEEGPGEGRKERFAVSNASGVAELQRLTPGERRLRVSHGRYSPRELTIQVGAMDTSEPLRILLDPLPAFALRIAYAEGTPLPAQACITVRSAADAELARSVEDDGLVHVFARPDGARRDLGGPVAIEVGLEGPQGFGGRGEQRRILPGLSAHGTTACSLLPWHPVEVQVDGLAPGEERVLLWLEMRGWAIPSELEALSYGEEVAADEAGSRSFRFLLPAGAYRLRSLTGTAPIDEDLVVQESKDVQRFRVVAR